MQLLERLNAGVEQQVSLRVKDIYSQAMLLYKEKQYEEAYKRFQQVEELMPHYARTEFYLQEISKMEK